MSGADMVGGCEPGGLLVEAGKEASKGDDAMAKSGVKIDKVPREPLAIVALALAVAVFGLSFVRTRKSMTGAVVLSVACLGALIGLWLKVGGDLKKDIDKYKDSGGEAGEMGAQMAKETELDAGPRMGLYLTCLFLIGGAVVAGRALKEPEGTELQES